ncbi:MAG TPA: enoyl-CoA hydratase/isomerase family protein, partial [Candidatus Angelobacter sp.]|nr:enoyl-CoA hydratase/isomerase family protein [Candidatus Angelobacter sp.]
MNTVSSFVMKSVVLSLDGPVATVRLNRPPLNVLDFHMMDEVRVTLEALERRSEVIAIILSGSERAFSAGVDVAIHTPEQVPTMLQKFHGLIGVLAKLRKITVAEVRGACLG